MRRRGAKQKRRAEEESKRRAEEIERKRRGRGREKLLNSLSLFYSPAVMPASNTKLEIIFETIVSMIPPCLLFFQWRVLHVIPRQACITLVACL
jgi:hypothetical protein